MQRQCGHTKPYVYIYINLNVCIYFEYTIATYVDTDAWILIFVCPTDCDATCDATVSTEGKLPKGYVHYTVNLLPNEINPKVPYHEYPCDLGNHHICGES